MSRPWTAAVAAFALVLGIGGAALATQAVLQADEPREVASSEQLPPTAEPIPGLEPIAVEERDTPTETPKEEPTAAPKAEKPSPPAGDVEKDEEPKIDKGPESKDDEPAGDQEVTAEAKVDDDPPPLVITSPAEGEHFSEKTIKFRGETEPGARVFAGPYEADVNDEGHWAIVLVLSEGGNRAVLHAEDAAGNVSEAVVTVYFEAPDKPKEEAEPEEEAGPWELVVQQKYGFCEEPIPYDVFYGETAPHAKVTITSPYGSGVTQAGKKGGWDLKVKFPDAPYGETFVVTIESIDQVRYLEFTSLAQDHEKVT